jgi:hypothetical protein
MMQPKWSNWFIDHASNDVSSRNMQGYSNILSSRDLEFEKLCSMVKEINTVILAADADRNVLIFHSPKNFGDTKTHPENKVFRLIGLGI